MGSSNLSLIVHVVGLIGIYSMYGVLQEGECTHSVLPSLCQARGPQGRGC